MRDWTLIPPAIEFISLFNLAGLLAKGAIVAGIALFLYRDQSLSPAAVKHRFICGAVVVLALLPLLGLFISAWELPLLPREGAWEVLARATTINALLWAYLLVAIGLCLRLLLQIIRTALITARAENAPESWLRELPEHICGGRVKVRISGDVCGPMTWGLLRPTILLPRNCDAWFPQARTMVLRHEAAHIMRGDWLSILLARWVGILYWPLPLMRTLCKRLSLSAEQACDDLVLAAGADASDYAELLVALAQRARIPAGLALADASELSVRVRYLVREIVDRSDVDTRKRWLYPISAVFAGFLSAISLVEGPRVLPALPVARPIFEVHPAAAPVTAEEATQILRPDRPREVPQPPEFAPDAASGDGGSR